MPVLKPGIPVTQDTPHLQVENKLSPGRYRFQLVAIDSAGLESAPAELVVLVNEPAVIDTTPPIRRPIVLRPDLAERLVRPVIAEPVKPVRPVIAEPVKPVLRDISRLIRPIKPPIKPK